MPPLSESNRTEQRERGEETAPMKLFVSERKNPSSNQFLSVSLTSSTTGIVGLG